MATDLTVVLEDRPGTLAALGEATGRAGVNLDGVCGFATDGEFVTHLLVEDAAAARRALEGAGVKVADEREAIVVDVEDRPGALGEVCRKVADAGVNIDAIYVASRTRLVLVAADPARARAALGA